jgi:sporulation protein YqfC
MKRETLINRITQRVDLPGESMPAQPIVELCGDSRVLIEHHRGVIEYGPEKIVIRVRYGTIHVFGNELKLCRMSGCLLVITGRIDKIGIFRG